MTKNSTVWWDSVEVKQGVTRSWHIGNLKLWVTHDPGAWSVSHRWHEEEAAVWQAEIGAQPPEGVLAERFALGETQNDFSLNPMTADRPVVARPTLPLKILPSQRVKVFVGSPLWIRMSLGDDKAKATKLCELPTRRLSDTWFGENTREGELCYALRTKARMDLSQLPANLHRVITPVVIENDASEPLVIERLNIPVPFLAIYSAQDSLWSDEVRLRRTDEEALTQLDVVPGPPPEVGDATRIAEPRGVAPKGHLFRAFSSLLGF